ncbi:MAG: polymer-forming cytoskeletal protein [Acidobacteria bacterium]|nr:polymer-forming cytoskeletal protein [Acidobacteriota bacterium]
MRDGSRGTWIGRGLHLQGDLIAEDDVTIAGEFTGNIACGGCVTVEAGGSVRGDITAANLVLEGSLEGSAIVAERFDLRAPGRMLGDVKASVVRIAERTFLRGRVLATVRMSTEIQSLRRRIRASGPAVSPGRLPERAPRA